jgi:hypothetical protein
VLVVLVSALSIRLLAHPAAKNDKSADMLPARFGWQWCPGESDSTVSPPRAAPIETGMVRTVRHGALGVEWFWCRSRSREDLVVLRARVTNYGSDAIDRVLLDFSLYDKDDSFLGNYSVALRKLDGHGASSVEDKLPTQFGEWTKWTAWSMRLASVQTN